MTCTKGSNTLGMNVCCRTRFPGHGEVKRQQQKTWPDKELSVLTEHPLPASRKCFSFGGLEEWAPGKGISLFKQSFIMPICYFTITIRQEPVIWVSHDAENRVKFISIKVSVLYCKNIRKINFLSQRKNFVLRSAWWLDPAYRGCCMWSFSNPPRPPFTHP